MSNDQTWRPNTAHRAVHQNHTGIIPTAETRPPRAPFDAFLIWGIASAAIFIIAGFIAIFSIVDARNTQDLAAGIVAAVFAASGFAGIILARIGTEIRRGREDQR